MVNNINYYQQRSLVIEALPANNEDFATQFGFLEITGTGGIRVINTGGASAAEGGMGNDNDDDEAKGEITKPSGEKAGRNSDAEDEDTRFDPIKKNVREEEKKADKE